VAECWEQFDRRSPQDAKAISTDRGWGLRLRAALAKPPLAGYEELTELIRERRMTAKSLAPQAQTERGEPDKVSAAPQTTPQEARIA
jgi:hypothetical protein